MWARIKFSTVHPRVFYWPLDLFLVDLLGFYLGVRVLQYDILIFALLHKYSGMLVCTQDYILTQSLQNIRMYALFCYLHSLFHPCWCHHLHHYHHHHHLHHLAWANVCKSSHFSVLLKFEERDTPCPLSLNPIELKWLQYILLHKFDCSIPFCSSK